MLTRFYDSSLFKSCLRNRNRWRRRPTLQKRQVLPLTWRQKQRIKTNKPASFLCFLLVIAPWKTSKDGTTRNKETHLKPQDKKRKSHSQCVLGSFIIWLTITLHFVGYCCVILQEVQRLHRSLLFFLSFL